MSMTFDEYIENGFIKFLLILQTIYGTMVFTI